MAYTQLGHPTNPRWSSQESQRREAEARWRSQGLEPWNERLQEVLPQAGTASTATAPIGGRAPNITEELFSGEWRREWSLQIRGRRHEEPDSSSEDVEGPTRAERIKRLKAAGMRWHATWKRFAFWILAYQVDLALTEAYCCLTSWLRRGKASLMPDHRQWRLSRQRAIIAEKLEVDTDWVGRNEPPYRRHLPSLARLRGKMNVWRYTEH